MLAVVALLVTPAVAQQIVTPAGPDQAVERGRELLSRLVLNPEADARVFAALPAGEPEQLLTAVSSNAQGYQTDPAGWTEMHRALAALSELSLYRNQGFKAAVYESFQSTLYINYDQDYAQALAASERALRLGEQYAPPESQALYQGDVGRNLSRVGRGEEALVFLRRARALARSPFDGFSANNWRSIVLGELTLGRLAVARTEATRFLEGSRSAEATPIFRGYAQMAMSDVQMEEGGYEAMATSVKAALVAAGDDPNAQIVGYAAVAQLLQGVLAASVTLPYDEALALARRVAKQFPDSPVPLETFAEGAIRKRRRAAGDLDAMLRADDRALTAARIAGRPVQIAESLLDASLDYGSLNAARQAIALLEEASTLLAGELTRATYPSSEGVVHLRLMVLTNLGLSYAAAGELERAQSTWDEVIRVVNAVPPGLARQQVESSRTQALVGRAAVAELEEDFAHAAQLYQQALPLAQGKGGPSRSEILSDLARASAGAVVDPARVASIYQQAIEAAGAERNRENATTIRLAYARFLTIEGGHALPDASAAARRQLAEAAQAAADLHIAQAEWKVAFGRGLLEESDSRIEAAIAEYSAAVERFERLRGSLTLDEHRQSLVDNKAVQELYSRLVALLTRVGRSQQAWAYLERDKARSFSEMLRGRDAGPALNGMPGPLGDMERRILVLTLQASSDNAAMLRASGRDPAVVGTELRKLQSAYAVVAQQARLRAATTNRGEHLPAFEELRQQLAPSTALVEYALLPDSIAVFVGTRDGLKAIETSIDGKRLRRDLLRLRRALGTPEDAPEAETLIASVSGSLVAPIETAIAGKKHLVVVAAGAMNYVPFQVLRMRDGQQIVDRFTVTNLPSASTLPLLRTTRIGDRYLFIGALGNTAVPGWNALSGTEREARAIAAIFPGATVATGSQFTSGRVLDALQHATVVHLATHGDLDDQIPLLSSIITSPTAGENPRVTVYQLMNTRVAADLVVLSACQTATGKLLGGDEVTGLTRTLLVSGANAVVSTLWNVDDAVTADLMAAFYRGLRAGHSPAESLRAAQLSIRATHPQPAYWAPFIATARQ